ncbi:hypothetical protein SFUMM280S_09770 [Streptomyces fumanus]
MRSFKESSPSKTPAQYSRRCSCSGAKVSRSMAFTPDASTSCLPIVSLICVIGAYVWITGRTMSAKMLR